MASPIMIRGIMMNKRGLLFHWIILSILFAVGLFLLVTKSYTVQNEPVGTWHLNFIANTLHLAEIDLLEMDQNASEVGWNSALSLAKSGGFSDKSTCGQIEGRNIWNDNKRWCLPVVKEVAGGLVEAKISQKEITFTGEVMRGIGENKVIVVPGKKIQKYEYSTNIAVDLDYSFDEYAQLEQEARSLVKRCKDFSEVISDLNKCITQNKADHWQLCKEGVVDSVGIFCVNSPGNYVIKGQPVVYELGLKFGEDGLVS